MKKKLLLAALSILVILFALSFRTLYHAGSFKKINPHSDFEATVLKGITGAEDITFDQTTGIALISADDRRKVLSGSPSKGGIYALDVSSSEKLFVELTAGFTEDFHPHGISLYHDGSDSTKWLFVVNHRTNGHFIEIFQWTDTTLVHSESIQNSMIVSPNDVLGVGKRQFYFTNDHDSSGGVSQLKDFLLIGTGQIGFYDGENAEILSRGINYANGITISPDGLYVYVAACTAGKIFVYKREPWTLEGQIDCKTGIDNLEMDENGVLWTAAHPKLLAFLEHAKDASKRSPSQILRISLASPAMASEIKEIYLSDGNPLSGSSVAAAYGGKILMGTVFEDGILLGNLENQE